jgi:hypothetical protein
MRSARALASPLRTSSTMSAMVKPCAIMSPSGQPASPHSASSSSARRRSGLGATRAAKWGHGVAAAVVDLVGRIPCVRRPFEAARACPRSRDPGVSSGPSLA